MQISKCSHSELKKYLGIAINVSGKTRPVEYFVVLSLEKVILSCDSFVFMVRYITIRVFSPLTLISLSIYIPHTHTYCTNTYIYHHARKNYRIFLVNIGILKKKQVKVLNSAVPNL